MTTHYTEKISSKHYRIKLICAFLLIIVVTLFVYWNLSTHGFTNFDDYLYVTENEHVNTGICVENIIWAFTVSNGDKTYWHPITWLSHMLDCQMYGLDPGYHHLTNLFIHIINALLLFLIFNQMTGAMGKSAMIALLFAIHPLNVDSVAWIAERKNVLSSLFWMLTIITYIHYSRRPGVSRYLMMMLVFSAGLLAKPMLVTLPFALLLLDYWPLNRIHYGHSQNSAKTFSGNMPQKASPLKLFVEKIPLIILSLIVTGIVYISLAKTQSILTANAVAMDQRFFNAFISYINYLYKIVWPFNLAVFYPFPEHIPLWKVISSGIALTGITFFVIYRIKKSPYLFTGWFWFIGTLVPVIGFIQGGLWPAMADRWAYIPAIGFFIMIIWGGDEIISRWPVKFPLKTIISSIIIAFLSIASRNQLTYWQNSIMLFEHTLNVTENNASAHLFLGTALAEKDLTDQAILQYGEALRLQPDNSNAHTNLGNALYKSGHIEQALSHYRIAVMLDPDDAKAQIGLGHGYADKGQLGNAIFHYNAALKIQPTNPQIQYNVGVLRYKQFRYSEAFKHFQTAIRLKPNYENAKKALNMVKKYQ